MVSEPLSNGCTQITCSPPPNPNVCLENNGNGYFHDADCIDCTYPPLQRCDGYYTMISTPFQGRCTRILCIP